MITETVFMGMWAAAALCAVAYVVCFETRPVWSMASAGVMYFILYQLQICETEGYTVISGAVAIDNGTAASVASTIVTDPALASLLGWAWLACLILGVIALAKASILSNERVTQPESRAVTRVSTRRR